MRLNDDDTESLSGEYNTCEKKLTFDNTARDKFTELFCAPGGLQSANFFILFKQPECI